MTNIHGTLIAIDEQGILLTGDSGSGKSDLALRMIEQGAELVCDDYVEILKKGKELIGFPPKNIRGLLEVRNLGVFKFANLPAANIKLVIELTEREETERYPEDHFYEYENVKIPSFKLYGFDASTPAKVGLALAHVMGHMERVE